MIQTLDLKIKTRSPRCSMELGTTDVTYTGQLLLFDRSVPGIALSRTLTLQLRPHPDQDDVEARFLANLIFIPND